MKNKERKASGIFEYAIPIVFIIVCSFFYWKFDKLKEQVSKSRLEVRYSQDSHKEAQSRSFHQLNSENTKLDSTILLVDTSTLDTVSMSSILSFTKTIVFRYSELDCMACVDSVLIKLKDPKAQIDGKDVVILTHYSKLRNLVLFARTNKIDFPIYGIVGNKLGIPAEKLKIPYLFVTDSQLSADLVFVPDKRYSHETENYLKIVKKRFFSPNLK